ADAGAGAAIRGRDRGRPAATGREAAAHARAGAARGDQPPHSPAYLPTAARARVPLGRRRPRPGRPVSAPVRLGRARWRLAGRVAPRRPAPPPPGPPPRRQWGRGRPPGPPAWGRG